MPPLPVNSVYVVDDGFFLYQVLCQQLLNGSVYYSVSASARLQIIGDTWARAILDRIVLSPRCGGSCVEQESFRLAHAHAGHMIRRNLGNTGLEVSVLGFGASPLGGVFQVCQLAASCMQMTVHANDR